MTTNPGGSCARVDHRADFLSVHSLRLTQLDWPYLTVARTGYNHGSFKLILNSLFLPQRQLNESPVASLVYCTDDGSVGFTFNINRLQCGVCKSCARTCLAVPPLSTVECDVAIGDAGYSLARDCGT